MRAALRKQHDAADSGLNSVFQTQGDHILNLNQMGTAGEILLNPLNTMANVFELIK